MLNQIEIDKLLKPITKQSPCGKDLRKDTSPESLYYTLKDLRLDARDIERQNEIADQPQDVTAQWQKIFELSHNILATKSKDIEITCWLIEASARLHGFNGLTKGFCLLQQYIQLFWDSLTPQDTPNEESLKLSLISGLNGSDHDGTLIHTINNIPICHTDANEPISKAIYHYCMTTGKTIANSEISLKQINDFAANMDPQFFTELNSELQEACHTYLELTSLLTEKFKRHAPPSSRIKNALDDYKYHLSLISKECVQIPNGSKDDEHKISFTNTDRAELTHSISSRQSAVASIINTADYFEQFEPHSPISYILRRTAKWANLPLPELIKELVDDDNSRFNIYKLTGIDYQK